MPLYQFECLKCNTDYEEITPYDETGRYSKVKCPNCKSRRKVKSFTGCSYNFTNPVGTDRWNSDSTGHDYRYKYNLPNVEKQRKMAEEGSHMGPRPYSDIDDIQSGKYFGETK